MVADSAMRQGLVSASEVAEFLARSGGCKSRKVQHLAEFVSSKSEPAGETLLRHALITMGLFEFVEQYEVVVEGSLYRLDFAVPELMLAIEFDGAIKYSRFGPADEVLSRERRREVALQNAGWRVIRVNWSGIYTKPSQVQRTIAAVVRQRRADAS